ncbi:uncharacterized protein LOC129226345 [Uloborus diversus]|uniref:uncharacterized protein LOC129226345 n=1 Tax=Uloborus diversus TaxID=327109 RepID=UPI002409EA1B|nr:uncharacterized protein LOC129226345 [Uloborus diversus]
MFDSDMKESQENTVDLFDMDLTVAKAMLLYMYTREIEELPAEKILQLYVAADKYMLAELKEKCRNNVLENLSSKNIGEVFEIAKLHSDTIMAKTAKNFFANHVGSVLDSEEWERFSAEKLALSVELLSYTIKSNAFFF